MNYEFSCAACAVKTMCIMSNQLKAKMLCEVGGVFFFFYKVGVLNIDIFSI